MSRNESSGLDGSALAQWLDLEPLIPHSYHAYRPLLADALAFFLGRLPPPRLAAIIAEQLALPGYASVAERVVVLLRHCPTLHKLGQVVARDRRLASELRMRLQTLESLPPATPMAEVLPIIRRELGAAAPLQLGEHALAEASVAVVVPFAWRERKGEPPAEGVLKVLKPGVEERLQEELEIWSELGSFLEERCARYGLPALDYRDTLDSVRGLLLNEIRLDREQAHLAQAAGFYNDAPAVLIPRLLPFCTPRVTAMERVHGTKVTEAEGLSSASRRRLAETMLDALVARPFWSEAPRAAFHADPHAGNLMVTPEGRLAILDWSLVVELGRSQREAVVQAVLGALALDEAQVCRAVAALGRKAPGEAALRAAVADALGQVRRGVFPGLGWMLDLLDRLATSAGMGFPEELVLFRKSLLALSGVSADVAAACSADRVLLAAGLAQFLRELPRRLLALPGSRAFGTHVSNADLLGLWLWAPATATRFWVDTWRDLAPPVPSSAAPAQMAGESGVAC